MRVEGKNRVKIIGSQKSRGKILVVVEETELNFKIKINIIFLLFG
jgi:hypothetical protein